MGNENMENTVVAKGGRVFSIKAFYRFSVNIGALNADGIREVDRKSRNFPYHRVSAFFRLYFIKDVF